MKKPWLIIVFFFLYFPLSAESTTEFESNQIKYSIISDDDCTCKIVGYSKNLKEDLIIPSQVTYKKKVYTVTTIEASAFMDCSLLTSVVIPNSVTDILSSAFINCSSLTSITLPNTLNEIPFRAFSGCSSLKYIKIPNSVTTIGYAAFLNCYALEGVSIPDSLETIAPNAFENCTSLFMLLLPKSTTIIGAGAFKGCSSLTSINIPQGVSVINVETFNGCQKLTHIIIPDSVERIDQGAFFGCSRLKTLKLSNTLERIKFQAFDGCINLDSLLIPSSVTDLGRNILRNCKATVLLAGSNVKLDKQAFDQFQGELLCSETLSKSIDYANKRVCTDEFFENYFLSHKLLDSYIKNYVERRINMWQKKGEYEKTLDWQSRVTEEERNKKASEYLSQALKNYYKGNTFKLDKYDADSETYLVTGNLVGRVFVKVPILEAERFKDKWLSYEKEAEYSLSGQDIVISSFSVNVDGHKYKYTNQDKIEYATTKTEFNFAPIDYGNLASNKGSVTNQNKNSGEKTISVGNKSVSDIDENIPRRTLTNDDTFAIIIANEQYKYASNVQFAYNDGASFSKYCNQTLGIPEKNILFYSNATFGDMTKAFRRIEEIADALNGNINIIFYYAGHGFPDEKTRNAYLLPVDSESSILETCIKTSSLYERLKATGAKRTIVFMDACFSGSIRGEGMLASARGVRLNAKADEIQGNMVVMTAAQGDETAYPFTEKKHGLFTYYLLKKLKETAGTVALGTLADYVAIEVNKESVISNGRKQSPSVSSSLDASEWRDWQF